MIELIDRSFTIYRRLLRLKNKAMEYKDVIVNEDETKACLIDPFIRALGYDVTSPFDVKREYTCSNEHTQSSSNGRVDYMVYVNAAPVILLEAKSIKKDLEKGFMKQLRHYFSSGALDGVDIAVLTNGLTYWFFSRQSSSYLLCDEPFYIFNLLNFTERDASILGIFSKAVVDSRIVCHVRFNVGFTAVAARYLAAESTSAPFLRVIESLFLRHDYSSLKFTCDEVLARFRERQVAEATKMRELAVERKRESNLRDRLSTATGSRKVDIQRELDDIRQSQKSRYEELKALKGGDITSPVSVKLSEAVGSGIDRRLEIWLSEMEVNVYAETVKRAND